MQSSVHRISFRKYRRAWRRKIMHNSYAEKNIIDRMYLFFPPGVCM